MDKITNGWIHKKYGYRQIRVNGKTVPEHRYIMEQFLGRKLKRNELVHHIDGNRLNNIITNLEVMTLQEHTRMHMKHIGFPKLDEISERKRRENFLKSIANGHKKLPKPIPRESDDIRKEHSEKMKLWWSNRRKSQSST